MANKRSIYLKKVLAFTLAVLMVLGAFLDYGTSFASEENPDQVVAEEANRLVEASPDSEPAPEPVTEDTNTDYIDHIVEEEVTEVTEPKPAVEQEPEKEVIDQPAEAVEETNQAPIDQEQGPVVEESVEIKDETSSESLKIDENSSETESNLVNTEDSDNTNENAETVYLNEELEKTEYFMDSNPDHLDKPDSSPYAGVIRYDIYPETQFGIEKSTVQPKKLRSLGATRALGSPVIGTDHPANPGDVMLFKEAKPVEGMLNTWDVTLRIEGKDKPTTSDIVLVIDTSGSMNDNGRMTAAKKAANAFVDTLLAEGSPTALTTSIGIVSFDYYANVEQELTKEKTTLKGKIEDLSANGGTFTQAGIKQAEAMLANSQAAHKHIVLLSDGEPTYSYRIKRDQRRRGYVLEGRQYYTGTEYSSSDYNYNSRVGVGTNITTYVEDFNNRYAYYNHGNSAIAEARFAGDAGYNVFTIGLQTKGEGSTVLSKMKQGTGTFTEVTYVDQLTTVFQGIAGQIGAAVKDASVDDPMGSGFEIPAANDSDIKTNPETEFSYKDGTIFWDPGTLTTPLTTDSSIKYAEITYRIELNDEILSQTPNANGEYPTNGNAKINYTDVNGNKKIESFPVPTVNPVLYTVEKEVIGIDGNPVTNLDRNFIVNVQKASVDGKTYDKNYTLNPSTNLKTRVLTSLRDATTYKFAETNISDKYEVKYFVNGNEVNDPQFSIIDSNNQDVKLKVQNIEKSVEFPITKVWKNASENDIPDSIKVKVIGKVNEVQQVEKEYTINKTDNWEISTGKLPMYWSEKDNKGNYVDKKIKYSVFETQISGYTTSISGDVTNGYTITNYKDVVIKVVKSVTGNMGDKTKLFTFNYKINDVEGEEKSLKDQGYFEVTIPFGQSFEVVETLLDEYKTKINDVETNNGKFTWTYNASTADNVPTEILYVNDKTVPIPTGINTNNAPMLAVMVTFIAAGSMLLIRRRNLEI